MMNIISQEEINTIQDLCKDYKIINYTINPDGSIDVDGDVYLSRKGLTSLSLRFNKVSGDFYCSFNKLTSLEGCPEEVGGDFNCYDNKLTSLEFSPKEVGGGFYCDYNELPKYFNKLYTELSDDEKKIFIKYQKDLRIWDGGYDREVAQDLFDDIKDGLL